MKTEFKNYKTKNIRFLLLVIFVLLIANRTFAQCLITSPLPCACESNFDVSADCSKTCGSYSSDHTLITSATATDIIEIPATNFKTTSSVTVSQIELDYLGITTYSSASDWNTNNSTCTPVSPATSCNLTGITFTDNVMDGGKLNVKIAGNGSAHAVGDLVCFTITAIGTDSQDNPIQVTRFFTFKIYSSADILGDTHITTVDGVHYDFQAVGEFVALRSDNSDKRVSSDFASNINNFEIQTRQTAVPTAKPAKDTNSELKLCVSVNTAVAARIGTDTVTYEPTITGVADSTNMELRKNGKVIDQNTIPENGIDFGSGGRILKSPGGGIIIDFPDGTSLIVVPTHWFDDQWYLQLSIKHTTASKGIAGVIAPGSWLPALPDGSSLGLKPPTLHERFVELYQTFADAWRVTDKTSLFYYPPGMSTAKFTDKAWPSEDTTKPCLVSGKRTLPPIGLQDAQQLASNIIDPNMKADAIFDIMVTGEPKFAQGYLVLQRLQNSTTITTLLNGTKDTTKHGETVTVTATVHRQFSDSIVTGSVQFMVDGEKFELVKVTNGTAILKTTALSVGSHQIAATFIPDTNSTASSSSTFINISHIVIGGNTGILHEWWFWLILIIILLIIIIALRRRIA